MGFRNNTRFRNWGRSREQPGVGNRGGQRVRKTGDPESQEHLLLHGVGTSADTMTGAGSHPFKTSQPDLTPPTLSNLPVSINLPTPTSPTLPSLPKPPTQTLEPHPSLTNPAQPLQNLSTPPNHPKLTQPPNLTHTSPAPPQSPKIPRESILGLLGFGFGGLFYGAGSQFQTF